MCYRFELNNFQIGKFDDSIDVSYVIHLENNERYENIVKQLNIFHPTKKVYICFNKGYKNCDKPEHITKTNLDLIDTYINIFKHCKENGYKNALIFEDDFAFSKNILNSNYTHHINNFLNKHKGEEFVYMLGNLPILQMPYFGGDTSILLIGMGTHACFYSEKLINKTLDQNNKDILDWDEYIRKFRRYMFKLPLCYQLFSITENYNNWTNNLSTKIIKNVITLNKLDKQYEPGFTRMYWFSYILFYLFIILIIFLFSLIIIKFKK